MLRSDIIFNRMCDKEIRISDIAKYLDYSWAAVKDKLTDLSGKRLSLYEIQLLMKFLDLPVEVFINEDFVSEDEIQKRLLEIGYSIRNRGDEKDDRYIKRKDLVKKGTSSKRPGRPPKVRAAYVAPGLKGWTYK